MLSWVTDGLNIAILIFFQLFKATWWIVLPVVLFFRIQPIWLYNRRVAYSKKLDWILLEIKLPTDVIKTPKAMENVLEGLHGAYGGEIKGRDKWIEGKAGDLFSLEIVGTNGSLHFYVRCQRGIRNFVESKIYAQYPDSEIVEANDYTEELPADIPNEDYKLWGADMVLVNHWAYPLKTYLEFEDPEEERRLDPISQYAEMVSKTEEGEHVWMQILISPILTEVGSEAKDIRDELAGRKSSSSSGGGFSMIAELTTFMAELFTNFISFFFVSGEPSWTEGQGVKIESSEMKQLTFGEQKSIEKVETKQRKALFGSTIRIAYIARQDAFHGEHIMGLMGFFRQFSDLNSFKPASKTKSSGSLLLFKNQRNHIRLTRMFNAYKSRTLSVEAEKPYVLATDEIATMYHFPGKLVHAPFMPRIKSRTSEPPHNLPR